MITELQTVYKFRSLYRNFHLGFGQRLGQRRTGAQDSGRNQTAEQRLGTDLGQCRRTAGDRREPVSVVAVGRSTLRK